MLIIFPFVCSEMLLSNSIMFYLKRFEFKYMGVCKVSLMIKVQAKCFQITHNTITLPININKVPFALPRENQVIKNKNFH